MGEWSPRAVCCHVNGGEAWARSRHRAFAEWFCVYPQRVFINTTTAPLRIYIHLFCIYTFVSSDNWLVLCIYIYTPAKASRPLISAILRHSRYTFCFCFCFCFYTHILSPDYLFSLFCYLQLNRKETFASFPLPFSWKSCVFCCCCCILRGADCNRLLWTYWEGPYFAFGMYSIFLPRIISSFSVWLCVSDWVLRFLHVGFGEY